MKIRAEVYGGVVSTSRLILEYKSVEFNFKLYSASVSVLTGLFFYMPSFGNGKQVKYID